MLLSLQKNNSLFRLHHHHNQGRIWYEASGHNSFRTKEINFWYTCIGSGLGSSWWEMWIPLERRMLTILIIDYLVKTISLLSTITSHYLNIKPVHKYTMVYFLSWYVIFNFPSHFKMNSLQLFLNICFFTLVTDPRTTVSCRKCYTIRIIEGGFLQRYPEVT